MEFLCHRIQSPGPKSKQGQIESGFFGQGGRDLDQPEDPARELAEIHDSHARNPLDESAPKDRPGIAPASPGLCRLTINLAKNHPRSNPPAPIFNSQFSILNYSSPLAAKPPHCQLSTIHCQLPPPSTLCGEAALATRSSQNTAQPQTASTSPPHHKPPTPE